MCLFNKNYLLFWFIKKIYHFHVGFFLAWGLAWRFRVHLTNPWFTRATHVQDECVR